MLIPFQLKLKKAHIELVIVTITEGLCDVIQLLGIKLRRIKRRLVALCSKSTVRDSALKTSFCMYLMTQSNKISSPLQ